MAKTSMIVYYSWLELFEDLTDAEVGKLIKAAIAYDMDGTLPEFDDRTLRVLFKKMQQDIDDNRIRYAAKCQKNKENVEKRWKKDTNVYERIPPYTNVSEDTNVYERINQDTNAYEAIRSDTKNTDNEYEHENECISYKEESLNINNINNIRPAKKSFADVLFGRT